VRLSKDRTTDLLRSVGGLLFAAGALVLLARKSGHHQWGAFAQLLVVLIPAAFLYVLALGVLEETPSTPSGKAQPWQSVLMVASILLAPVALIDLLHWLGASTNHVLYVAAVFALTALLAGYAARRARVSYAVLLAGLSLLLTWLLVWGKIIHHPSADTYRWLLVAGAALLLVGAAGLARSSALGASELATAGGIAAVAAGVLGVIVGAFVGAFGGLSKAISSASETSSSIRVSGSVRRPGSVISSSRISSGRRLPRISSIPRTPSGHRISLHPPILRNPRIPRIPRIPRNPEILRNHHLSSNPFAIHTNGLQHFGWDLYLLVVSLALVWVGSRARVRGLGYVGGIGLFAFVVSVGAQITRLEAGRSPTAGIVGWPLALLIIGFVGLAAPTLYRRES
jgi:hypothetical protein